MSDPADSIRDRQGWPKPETRLEIGLRKLRDYRGGAVLSDAEADAVVARCDALENALREIVEFPIRDEPSAAWHFAEVRRIARAALAAAGERQET
jgi:hypothetical protein